MSSPLHGFSIRRPDGTLKDPEELRADAAKLIAAGQARAERMKTELAANVAEASSRDQAATGAVTAVGGLQSVRLSDRVKTMSPPQIAAAVMQAYREAAARAAARTQEIASQELADPRIVSEMQDLMPDLSPDEGASGTGSTDGYGRR